MSVERKTVYFNNDGRENTEETLKMAYEAASDRDIDVVVVSSTTGYTAEKALELNKGYGHRLVVVTHQTGYRAPGVQLMPSEMRDKLEKAGVDVYTGTDVLTGAVSAGIGRQRPELEEPQDGRLPWIVPPPNVIVAHTLRMFSQGVKVCAEIAMMASDAGLVPVDKPVVCVAGSHAGADTAMAITPAHSNRIRDMKLHEILAKPY